MSSNSAEGAVSTRKKQQQRGRSNIIEQKCKRSSSRAEEAVTMKKRQHQESKRESGNVVRKSENSRGIRKRKIIKGKSIKRKSNRN